MAFGNQPVDAGLIPTSSVYSPNNGFETLQGESGAFQDGSSNPSTAAIMSFLRPQIVQKTHNVTGSGGKTLTCAFANNNIAQNSIVVCVGMGEVEAANITLTVTDSNSNTYTQAVKASQSTTLESAIFYTTGIAVGANTITITIAGSSSVNTAIAVEIYEVWGPIAITPAALDATATGSNAGSTSISTGAVVPVAPNELALVAVSAAGGTITAGTNWTLDSTSLSPTGGNLVSFGAESQSLSTIASVTPAATLSSSNAWAACCATFKSVIVPIEGAINLAQVGGAVLALGQTAMAASVPVVIANNQGAIGNVVVQAVAGTALVADQTNSELRTSVYGKSTTAGDTPLGVDASGRVTSIIQAVGGTALAADVSNSELRASVYGKSSAAGDTALLLNSDGSVQIDVRKVAGGVVSNAGQTGAVQVGGAVATNNNVSVATNPLLIAGSDYGGTPKVQSLKVDSSGNGQVAVTNTPSVAQSGTWTAVPNAATSGGSTPFHALSAASNNATNVKSSAGQLYGFSISNTNAAARFFKLYDKATAPAPASDTPKQTIQIPPNTTVIRAFPVGLAFTNGIGFAAVVNISDTDNTSIGANDLSIDLDYK